jgi:hypothetical protein
MRGAIREDDGDLTLVHESPHDIEELNRFCNHFFDPKSNTKLTTIFCFGGDLTSSPAWAAGVASGTKGAIARPLGLSPADATRRNHYSLPDAREAMWRALTLKQFRNGTGPLLTDPSPDGAGVVLRDLPPPTDRVASGEPAGFSSRPATARREHRSAYWATTFFALGSQMHLIQDMAQPQHTRIEVHPIEMRNEYEHYSEIRAKSDEMPFLYRSRYEAMASPLPARPLRYVNEDSAAVPQFANISAFWSTAADGDVAKGIGLGDHSNSQFFSPAHNLGQGLYALPSNKPADYSEVTASDASGIPHRYLRGKVVDPLTGREKPMLMTRLTASAEVRMKNGWQASQRVGNKLDYMFDARLYDEYLGHLIPLAVRYSRGFLDYFFRGRLAITSPDEEVYGLVDHAVESSSQGQGFGRLKAKVANVSRSENPAQGWIVGVVTFRRNDCYDAVFYTLKPHDPTEAMQCRSPDDEITVSKPIAVSAISREPVQFTFDFPSKLPINATDIRFQVVFRGQLGEEADGIAVGGRDLYEPTYFAFQNDMDYISIGDNVYTRSALEQKGLPTLFNVLPQSCVVYAKDAPPKLVDSCFPSNATASIKYEIGRRPATVTISSLPQGQYARFAYIADSETTRIRRAESNCRWKEDEWETLNVRWQADFTDYVGGYVTIAYPGYARHRGIGGWFNTGCLYWGDNTGPKTEAWWTQMETLPDDLAPTPLRIDF